LVPKHPTASKSEFYFDGMKLRSEPGLFCFFGAINVGLMHTRLNIIQQSPPNSVEVIALGSDTLAMHVYESSLLAPKK